MPSITLHLSDKEMAALEALSAKQEMTQQVVLIQGLRLYQLLVHGHVTLNWTNGLAKSILCEPRAPNGDQV